MKELNKELTYKLLSLYVGGPSDRETLRHFMPVEWDEKKWCAATEGHHAILIPENDVNKVPAPPIYAVNVGAALPVLNENIEIDIGLLKETYGFIEFVRREITEECDSCDGYGSFEHYGNSYECKNCDSEGEIGIGKFETVRDPSVRIRVGASCFDHKYIAALITVIDLTEASNITIRYQKEQVKAVFTLDNGIVIMIAAVMEEERMKILEVPL